ncbi:MAG TPA: metal-binding protein [Cyanobacteria bacterium UBA11149]|nr:metal-binding protein [Cyanobacteria bacterium UBA11367]HBE58314.1 metal-binding protein [Cyanobacteria bacterium UBA11366]HBK62103.1 metal-binding protein [Cyanobacteria bacterium UBA11166]HBR76643.1 metal-binding protein [Cyanobacteria bacterium UBA11159]HBS68872.1 metal-binding protein [Cyanobacteria bacterium UBA11153]HBW92409.1 metal-binding protein [Cyanobacteria bacterium UBA11149]HCA94840.1 metal-binding protein [Cyanobacteria bacterium UBA9226]
MPSGRTHDRITLWNLPTVTVLTLFFTKSSDLTLIVSGGYLFGGLMLSPDLDLNSLPFKRWGWLRWIWIPYQKLVRHRSIFSHGVLIGTTLRILYLGCWVIVLGGLGIVAIALLGYSIESWQDWASQVARSQFQYRQHYIALFFGLELGAISHVLSDWATSTAKKLLKNSQKSQDNRKLLPKKKKKTRR